MLMLVSWFGLFLLQAEDGIRYRCVTGVQTCALPICLVRGHPARPGDLLAARGDRGRDATAAGARGASARRAGDGGKRRLRGAAWGNWRGGTLGQIGRASCRERG